MVSPSPSPRRSPRRIHADIVHALEQVRRAGLAGYFATLAGAAAWSIGLVDGTVGRALPATAGVAVVGVIVSHLTARGSRAAAALLLAGYLAAAIFLLTAATHPLFVGYVLVLWGLPLSAARHAFTLPRLVREFGEAWTSHEVQPGDVYTVRDGDGFAVVKVLAADETRVHVRQYALRYAERPWHVKSSTLERASAAGPGAYPHLPLDRAEFLRWEPALLRTEPLLPGELEALAAWRALHEPGPGHPAA